MAKSLNRAQIIGNLTRDPELRYTPNGTAVCSFSVATNRTWTTDTGEKREEAEFHRVVAWNKLAEICSQFLVKGRKVFIEGRLSTRSWNAQDGTQRNTTEIIASDMILLDSRRPEEEHLEGGGEEKIEPDASSENSESAPPMAESKKESKTASDVKKGSKAKSDLAKAKKEEKAEEEEIVPDDIPF